MGMEMTVRFAGAVPPWAAVRDRLQAQGFSVEMRMIDGQLAFPDEEPSADWQELRVSIEQGMTTLRRQGDVVAVITWGNADGPVRRAWQALTWALAEAGGGRIEAAEWTFSAAEFRARHPEIAGPEGRS